MERGSLGVEKLVSATAAAVGSRLGQVTEDLVDLMIREIVPLRDDERVVRLLYASVEENVATLLHTFEHGMDPTIVEAPAAALAYARLLAQREVPIVALVRAYRIGQARFLHWCFEELMNEGAPDPAVGEATRRMMELSFTYIDRVSEQVIETYQQERERWARNRSTVRMAQVQVLLTAPVVDVDAMESALGYRLRRDHLGLVVWFREPSSSPTELEQTIDALSRRAGAAAAPLFVLVDESSAWVWLALSSEDGAAQAIFEDAVADTQPAVCVSFGDPGHGVEGCRRTHEQALRAQAVALAAGPAGPRVTAFADIRPIALMSSDLDATRSWVQETLGGLAIDDEAHARLRETLRVFLSAGGSYTTAAARLALHKNSVRYRVQKAEEMLGRSVRTEERIEVELALLACHWLGPAVLAPELGEQPAVHRVQ
jgi:DNA-binding PucR family transcriptional regulator